MIVFAWLFETRVGNWALYAVAAVVMTAITIGSIQAVCEQWYIVRDLMNYLTEPR